MTQYKFCMMDADIRRPGGGVGSIRTTARGGGSRIGKILRASFMDGPQSIINNYGI